MNDKALYDKERKERLKEQGMCINCAKQPAEPNKTMCAICAEKQRGYTTERRKWLIEHGICANCGQQDAEPHKRLCFECAEKNRKRAEKYRANLSSERKEEIKEQKKIHQKQRRERLKEQGICACCGHRKAMPNKTMCVECAIKDRRAGAKWRNTEIPRDLRKELGYCYLCGKPLNKHHHFCDDCYEKKLEGTRKRNENPTEAMIKAREEYKKYIRGDNKLVFKGRCKNG